MKKVLICIMSLLIITGCSGNEQKKIELSDNFTIETKETGVCKSNDLTKYSSVGDIDIYLSCLSNIYLKDGNNKIELKNYLSGSSEEFEKKMDKVVSILTIDEVLYDGGTKIYVDNQEDSKTNKGITIVRCHTMDGNKNIYIGPDGATLDNYCE